MVWELCSEKIKNQNYVINYNLLHEVHPGKLPNSTEGLFMYVLNESSRNGWSVFNSISLSSLHIHKMKSVLWLFLLSLLSVGRESPTMAVISSQCTQLMVLYGPLLVRVGCACSTVSRWREQRYSWIWKTINDAAINSQIIHWMMHVDI